MTRVVARATLLAIALREATEWRFEFEGKASRDNLIHLSRELRREIRRVRS